MVQSLYVLGDPSHHKPCRQWAEKTLADLPEKLQREIPKLFKNEKGWCMIGDFWTMNPGLAVKSSMDEDIRQSIMKVRNIREPLFSYIYLGLTTTDIKPARVGEWLGRPEVVTPEEWNCVLSALSRKHAEYYLTHPDDVKNRMAWILINYWNLSFKKIWPMLEVYLTEKLKEEKIKWDRSDPIDYIRKMHKDIIFDGEYFLFLKNPDYGIQAKNIKKIRMMASAFSAPHLMINTIGGLVTGTHNVDFRTAAFEEEISNEAMSRLNALSDKTRLKIIRIIWNDFSTTKEIAEMVSITMGAVSMHLKLLKNSNLVEVKRIKKHVYYRMKKEPLQNLPAEIEKYLEKK